VAAAAGARRARGGWRGRRQLGGAKPPHRQVEPSRGCAAARGPQGARRARPAAAPGGGGCRAAALACVG